MTKARQVNVAEEVKVVKVLGLFWNIDTDRYLYNTHFEWSGKFTKRSALQYTNNPYFYEQKIVLTKIMEIKVEMG